ESPNEAAAVLLAGYAKIAGNVRLLVRECHPVPPGAYVVQERFRVVIHPSFLAPLVKKARNDGWSLVLVHTHPFADHASFSPVDDDGESVLMPSLFSRANNRPHGSLVLTRHGCAARSWKDREHLPLDTDDVIEAGSDVRVYRGERTSL